jgi:hypothetical protein
MKCIKKGSEIQRVANEKADVMVKSGWAFCPKKEWKVLRDEKAAKSKAKRISAEKASGAEGAAEPKDSNKSRKSNKKGERGPKHTSKYKKKNENKYEEKFEQFVSEAPKKQTVNEILDTL